MRKNKYRVLVKVVDRVFEKEIREDSAMLPVINFERYLTHEGYNIEGCQSFAENVEDAHDSVGDNPII